MPKIRLLASTSRRRVAASGFICRPADPTYVCAPVELIRYKHARFSARFPQTSATPGPITG